MHCVVCCSSFKPWRKGKTGRAASDTGVGDGHTGSGLPATMGSPEAAALRGATPRTPRTPANNLVSISVSTGQQTEVNLRPSLLAAQKAAEQAAEAAAAELRPQRKSEQVRPRAPQLPLTLRCSSLAGTRSRQSAATGTGLHLGFC